MCKYKKQIIRDKNIIIKSKNARKGNNVRVDVSLLMKDKKKFTQKHLLL